MEYKIIIIIIIIIIMMMMMMMMIMMSLMFQLLVSFVSLAWASSETHNLLNTKKIKPLAHKMTVVVPGIRGGDFGNWE